MKKIKTYLSSIFLSFLLIMNYSAECKNNFGLPAIQNNTEPSSSFELIYNGDFELGFEGFLTDYDSTTTNLDQEHYYSIINNPQLIHSAAYTCGDHTTGLTNMMAVNGSEYLNQTVWSQVVNNVTPNRNYRLRFWYTSIFEKDPSVLLVYINGMEVSDTIYLTWETCSWKEFSIIWPSFTSNFADIKIIDIKRVELGNDFALDDISLKPVCSLEYQKGSDKTICDGELTSIEVTAINGIPPYSYQWKPSTGLSSPTISNPTVDIHQTTTYYFTVSDSLGCSFDDSVKVTVIPNPPPEIKTNHSTKLCPCETVTLSAPEGFLYLWSTGSTEQNIVADATGTYSVDISNTHGCKSHAEISVEKILSETTVKIDSFKATPGETVTIPVTISTKNISNCSIKNYKTRIRFNKSLLLPVDGTPFGLIDGNDQVIDLEDEANDSLLKNLKFIAVLGNSECTDIKFEYFDWDCSEAKATTENGRFCLENVCIKPNPRLFKDTPILNLSQNYPNPASSITRIDYTTMEPGSHSIILSNYLGEKVLRYSYDLLPGKHFIILDVSNVAAGVYQYTLQTPTETTSKILDVIK